MYGNIVPTNKTAIERAGNNSGKNNNKKASYALLQEV